VVRYLLDTNVVSEVVRPVPEPTVLARFAAAEGMAALSSVTWHELRYGVERMPVGRRRKALEAFVRSLLGRYPVLPYDEDAAQWHARERVRLAALGRPASFADGQIAAAAATRDAVLVTRNTQDFTGFAGIEVVSWWARGDDAQP